MVLRRNCNLCRVNRQSTGFRRDHVVRRHVFRAVHDSVAWRDRVVARRRLGHVRHSTRGLRHKHVTVHQGSARHRHCGVAVSSSIVRPISTARRNGDRHGGVRHRQLAIGCRHCIVGGIARCERIARHLVRHRALARVRDAARHHRADRVAANQAYHVILRPALRCAIVRELMVLRRHRHSCRSHFQVTKHSCHSGIVACILHREAEQVLHNAFRNIGDMRIRIRCDGHHIARGGQRVAVSAIAVRRSCAGHTIVQHRISR